MRVQAVRGAAAIGLAVLLGLPAVAGAAIDDFRSLKTRSATSAPVAGNQAIATATATCKKGTRVVSGGFLISPPPGPDLRGIIYESQRIGQRSWRASAQGVDTNASPAFTITAKAYCHEEAPKAKTATATFQGGTAVTCPSGRIALSGGFSTPPPVQPSGLVGLTYVSAKLLHPNAFTASGVGGPGVAAPGTSYVYCAKPKQVPNTRERTGAAALSNSFGENMVAGVSCPGKQTPFAGGFFPFGTASPNNFAYVYESLKSGRTWRTSGIHGGPGPYPGLTLSTVAFCS